VGAITGVPDLLTGRRTLRIIIPVGVAVGLYLTSLYSYLLFHGIVEIFSVSVAIGIFFFSWNARRFMANEYLVFLGIVYLFVASVTVLHILAYTGMNVFPGFGTNLPTQLWVASRYLEALSLLIAPIFIVRRIPVAAVFATYSLVSALLITAVFTGIFPDAFIEGRGLTAFKVTSEYLIVAILVGAAFSLYRKREELAPEVLRPLLASIALTILAELSFTLYAGPYALFNMVGHLFTLGSFYLIYSATVKIGLQSPYEAIYRRLNSQTVELTAANERLLELDRLKALFIASMSHELRTPLNSIIGFTGVILQGMSGPLNEEQKDQLRRANRAGKHLLALITDVIDISKIEAGSLDVYVTEADVADLMEEALSGFRSEIEEKGLSLRADLPDDVTVSTDRRRLLQCMINLVSNAVKYTETGGISVVARDLGESVEIAVEDTGIGIDGKDVELLFTAFSRLESRLRTKTPGTGLGLYLTKKIATEMLNGTITASSIPGKGSTFTLSFPKHLV